MFKHSVATDVASTGPSPLVSLAQLFAASVNRVIVALNLLKYPKRPSTLLAKNVVASMLWFVLISLSKKNTRLNAITVSMKKKLRWLNVVLASTNGSSLDRGPSRQRSNNALFVLKIKFSIYRLPWSSIVSCQPMASRTLWRCAKIGPLPSEALGKAKSIPSTTKC